MTRLARTYFLTSMMITEFGTFRRRWRGQLLPLISHSQDAA